MSGSQTSSFLRYQNISLPATSITFHVVYQRFCHVARMGVPRDFHLRPAPIHQSRAHNSSCGICHRLRKRVVLAPRTYASRCVSVSLSLCGVRRCQERSLRISTSPQLSLPMHLFHEPPFTTCLPASLRRGIVLRSVRRACALHSVQYHYHFYAQTERTLSKATLHKRATAEQQEAAHSYIYIYVFACVRLSSPPQPRQPSLHFPFVFLLL